MLLLGHTVPEKNKDHSCEEGLGSYSEREYQQNFEASTQKTQGYRSHSGLPRFPFAAVCEKG